MRLSKQMRFVLLSSLLALAALVAAPTATAARLTKCQKLAREYRDLSKAKAFVVVLIEYQGDEEELRGCRLPNGKVYQLAESFDDGVNSEQVTVDRVSGPWALFTVEEDGTAGTSSQTSLANVATGRTFSLGGSSCPPPLSGSPCTSGELLGIQFSAKGRVVTAQSARPGVQIIGYNTRAQATLLDQGSSTALPAAALRFKREVARWTHAGSALSAALSERPCKLSGTDLAPAKDVVLFRRAAKDEVGEPGSELVGCVKPAGPLRVVGSAGSFGLGERTVAARSVQGSWVLVSGSASNQYGAEGGAAVADLRSGRSYSVFTYSCGIGTCQGVPALSAALLNDRGQAATALEFQGQTGLTAFTSTGARRPLDSGPSAELPAGSLRLSGSTASWTRNGEAKSFDIAEG